MSAEQQPKPEQSSQGEKTPQGEVIKIPPPELGYRLKQFQEKRGERGNPYLIDALSKFTPEQMHNAGEVMGTIASWLETAPKKSFQMEPIISDANENNTSFAGIRDGEPKVDREGLQNAFNQKINQESPQTEQGDKEHPNQ